MNSTWMMRMQSRERGQKHCICRWHIETTVWRLNIVTLLTTMRLLPPEWQFSEWWCLPNRVHHQRTYIALMRNNELELIRSLFFTCDERWMLNMSYYEHKILWSLLMVFVLSSLIVVHYSKHSAAIQTFSQFCHPVCCSPACSQLWIVIFYLSACIR